MDWKTIGHKVADSAPFIGQLLGGPAGSSIGNLIAANLGTASDPEAVMKELERDPEALLKIREIESRQAIRLEELALESIQEENRDRQGARNREIETTKATGKRDINLYVLAWTVITGFFVLMGIMIFATLPQDNIGPVNQLFGALATGFGMVLQYFFGSSKGSADKTAAMLVKGKS